MSAWDCFFHCAKSLLSACTSTTCAGAGGGSGAGVGAGSGAVAIGATCTGGIVGVGAGAGVGTTLRTSALGAAREGFFIFANKPSSSFLGNQEVDRLVISGLH